MVLVYFCLFFVSSSSFSVVLAFLMVMALYAVLFCTIFVKRVCENVVMGADQKSTLP